MYTYVLLGLIIISLIAFIIYQNFFYKKSVFQHNSKIDITYDSYIYVTEYKRQLIRNITKLFDDLDIKFVISSANLIEYIRGKPIFSDDDLDIRFDIKDIDKWRAYCSDIKNIDNHKYGLVFDERFDKIDKQLYNGIQARLKNFENINLIKTYPEMDIHMDVVDNTISLGSVWYPYDIDFSKIRKIKYLGVDTYAPSKKDSHRILSKEYADDYRIPRHKSVINE